MNPSPGLQLLPNVFVHLCHAKGDGAKGHPKQRPDLGLGQAEHVVEKKHRARNACIRERSVDQVRVLVAGPPIDSYGARFKPFFQKLVKRSQFRVLRFSSHFIRPSQSLSDHVHHGELHPLRALRVLEVLEQNLLHEVIRVMPGRVKHREVARSFRESGNLPLVHGFKGSTGSEYGEWVG